MHKLLINEVILGLYCITAWRVRALRARRRVCVRVCRWVDGWVRAWIFPCHWMMATGFTWKQYLSWTCTLLARTPEPSTILDWGMSSQQTERTVCLDLTLWSPDPTRLSVLQGCTMKIDCDFLTYLQFELLKRSGGATIYRLRINIAKCPCAVVTL